MIEVEVHAIYRAEERGSEDEPGEGSFTVEDAIEAVAADIGVPAGDVRLHSVELVGRVLP